MRSRHRWKRRPHRTQRLQRRRRSAAQAETLTDFLAQRQIVLSRRLFTGSELSDPTTRRSAYAQSTWALPSRIRRLFEQVAAGHSHRATRRPRGAASALGLCRRRNQTVPKVRQALAGSFRGGYHGDTDPKEDPCLERRFAHFYSLSSSLL